MAASVALGAGPLFLPVAQAAKTPAASEVKKLQDAWNAKFFGEKPLTTTEAEEMLTDYMHKFPDMSVQDIIKAIVDAN